MKDITVENFNYSNVREWINGYTHKQKVELAVYCAELVIDLYTGTSDAPKIAIQAAKDWILNPSEENKKKCKSADAAYAAAYAAYAAYVADAAKKSIKEKIVNYLLGKAEQPKQELEWKNGDECVHNGEKHYFVGFNPVCDQDSVLIVDETGDYFGVYLGELSKPKSERELVVEQIVNVLEENKPYVFEEVAKVLIDTFDIKPIQGV